MCDSSAAGQQSPWHLNCNPLLQMDPLTISAASGMRSRLEALDILANNVANAATPGYKADRELNTPYVSFEAAQEAAGWLRPDPTVSPNIERHWTDYSQGNLQLTGNSLNLALSGPGFFEVSTAAGPRWTRAGVFEVSRAGKLQTQEGHELRVKPADGSTYLLNPQLPISITVDGMISQNGESKGTIEILRFENPGTMDKQGNSYFRMEDPNVKPAVTRTTEVRQGYLESANNAATESAVRLVSVMRQFESLQKALTLGGEMNRRSVEEVGRVGN